MEMVLSGVATGPIKEYDTLIEINSPSTGNSTVERPIKLNILYIYAVL